MDGDSFKNLLTLKNLTIVFIALTILNLIYLIYVTVKNPKTTIVEKIVNIAKPSNSPESKSKTVSDQFCPQSCINQIYEATASVKTVQPAPTSDVTPTPQSSITVKEYFIPFGSGSSSADNWQDISGIQAIIDTDNYPELKTVTLEASVRIPTGNGIAYIRLFNITDKHPVWFSEVSVEGGTAKLLLSKPITLDTGSKVYQVQMKTSLSSLAIFDQARLHIIIY